VEGGTKSGRVDRRVCYDGEGASDRYAYTGREQDSITGLQGNRDRPYDPKVGVFYGRDPLGVATGPNAYKYGENQPTGYTDPSGLDRRPSGSFNLPDMANLFFDPSDYPQGLPNAQTLFFDPSNSPPPYYLLCQAGQPPRSTTKLGDARPHSTSKINDPYIRSLQGNSDGPPPSSPEDVLLNYLIGGGRGLRAGDVAREVWGEAGKLVEGMFLYIGEHAVETYTVGKALHLGAILFKKGWKVVRGAGDKLQIVTREGKYLGPEAEADLRRELEEIQRLRGGWDKSVTPKTGTSHRMSPEPPGGTPKPPEPKPEPAAKTPAKPATPATPATAPNTEGIVLKTVKDGREEYQLVNGLGEPIPGKDGPIRGSTRESVVSEAESIGIKGDNLNARIHTPDMLWKPIENHAEHLKSFGKDAIGQTWPGKGSKIAGFPAHAHHIVMQVGQHGAVGPAKQARAILGRHGINPYEAVENLVWAPKSPYLESEIYARKVLERLQKVEGRGKQAIIDELKEIGKIVSGGGTL
jgi:RHS repeat-associated protein